MSGFHVNGVDLDDIFMKKNSNNPWNSNADAIVTNFRTADNKDLNKRYIKKTSSYPNNETTSITSILHNGDDLNTIFAAKYEWGNYSIEARGSQGDGTGATSLGRFGNNPHYTSAYGANITATMSLIKK